MGHYHIIMELLHELSCSPNRREATVKPLMEVVRMIYSKVPYYTLNDVLPSTSHILGWRLLTVLLSSSGSIESFYAHIV